MTKIATTPGRATPKELAAATARNIVLGAQVQAVQNRRTDAARETPPKGKT